MTGMTCDTQYDKDHDKIMKQNMKPTQPDPQLMQLMQLQELQLSHHKLVPRHQT